jgi:KDO2-lipid IV(A) lauroyltransferase
MYYIVYGILYLFSLLPLWILYIISDGFFILTYHLIRYRRDVVMSNLAIAFPEKSEEEKIVIAKKFYHNFLDNFIEAIKMLSASDEFVFKHFKANYEVVEELYKTGRSCHLLLGHTFNWEVGNHAVGLKIPYKFLVVYMPITNKAMDRIFYKMRTRGKTFLLSALNMRKDMMQHRNSLYALALAADQNPSRADKAYWLNFFGRPTPFVTGPEKGAKAANLPVGFCYITKPRRGYYQLHFSIGELNPEQLAPGELTVRFVRYLEKVIRENPDMWLWSHRRWKYDWKEEYRKLWIDKDEPIVQT